MRTTTSAVLVCLLLSFTVTAFAGFYEEEAQPEYNGLRKGMSEVSLYGAYTFSNGDDTWAVAAGYGYFVGEGLTLGAGILGTKDLWYILPGITYNFQTKNSSVIPFIGVDAGWAIKRVGNDEFAWGGRGGLKFLAGQKRAFFLQYQYIDYGDLDTKILSLGMANYY